MNYLGLDYGTKNLGVALATGPLAEPLAVISASKALKILLAIIENHQITEIIIGRPDKTLKPEFEKFLDSLKIVNCKLIIVDETLSTRDAIKSLLHTTKARRKAREHAAAAAILLQSWLDSQG